MAASCSLGRARASCLQLVNSLAPSKGPLTCVANSPYSTGARLVCLPTPELSYLETAPQTLDHPSILIFLHVPPPDDIVGLMFYVMTRRERALTVVYSDCLKLCLLIIRLR